MLRRSTMSPEDQSGRARRHFGTAVVPLLVLVALTAAAALPQAAAAGKAPIRAYRGLGTWVDIYDAEAWNNPAAAAADMKSHGVRTLYLETANYHRPAAPQTMFRRTDVAGLIRESHRRGIKVVAWYLPGLKDLSLDYKRSVAAIRYRTPDGQKFDSFALDIEASIVKDVKIRNRRLLSLSKRLRRKVGSRYPLGAITPSPAGMAMHTGYWPGFPYRDLARIYDVFMPMGYYTYHGAGYGNAYRDTRNNIRIIREQTGRSSVPIHVIGGEGAKSSAGETQAYVRVLRESGAIGGGMYDWATTKDSTWRALRNIDFTPRQRIVLPCSLPFIDSLGYFRGDKTHPREAFYEVPGQEGDRVLRYRLFDAQENEVRLVVNWKTVGWLPAGPPKAWTHISEAPIPAALLRPKGRNTIGFIARGKHPQWPEWGVRRVSLVTP